MTPDELIDYVCPKIRDLGWAHYFVAETMQRGTELGLDGLRFYFIGRGGVLGDVEASVVRAAFGYFEPGLITKMWDSSRRVIDPRTAGRDYVACAAEHGRRKLSDVADLEAFVAALDAVNDAADETGLSLYAAAKAEPFVEDAPGRAMQLLALLREFRGSAHLMGLRVVGLDSATAHAANRPGDLAMFGWASDALPEITDEHRARRDEAERLTDQIVRPAYAALDESQQQALVSGIDAVEKALTS